MKTVFQGTVYYDATCRFCTGSMDRLRPWLEPRGFVIAPFEDGAAEAAMLLRTADGVEWRGVDALLHCLRAYGWARPAAWLGTLPGIHGLLTQIYGMVAARRHCLAGACALRPPRDRGRLVWTFLAVGAVGLGFLLSRGQAPWLALWTLAVGLFLSFKGLALGALPATGRPRGWRLWAFGLAWPGMDAGAFAPGVPRDPLREGFPWISLLGMVLALALLRVLPRLTVDPVWLGACGMAALLLVLHFGSFDLLAWAWHRGGIPVTRIMQDPWAARSLDEFWGRRWNLAFSDVARTAFFRPVTRRWGAETGLLAAFLVSGLAHEWVISLPAGAGWGLPTGYFLIQGIGALWQRRIRWTGFSARLLTVAFVILPLPLLFHGPFLERCLAPAVRWWGSW